MNKRLYILVTALIILIGISGISLAYLQTQNNSGNQEDASISVANFGVILLTDIPNVTMNDTYPMTDLEGQITGTKATFQIKNTGSTTANYKVSLVDSGTNTIKNDVVRYQLKRVNESTSAETVFDIQTLDATGLIDTGSIDSNVIYTYTIALWVKYDVTNHGDTFSKKIEVEGMQSPGLDNSGANYPELLDNMIPVYYEATSDTTGDWKKADSKNLNATYKWFDYNNQMWANAVTVKETGTQTRDYYLNAATGTTINMDDITSMWVWIPRYKYVIFNGNNEAVNEQMINVIFEHGKDKTGTVVCVDNIQNADDSSSSETCTDTTNNGIVNGKSTYTHPAFTFGTEELTGIWMAKFEMSTDDSTCYEASNTTNCDKSGLNIFVKPDVFSLRNIGVLNAFANIRQMELYENIHGFPQASNATSLNESSNGEIVNDNNNYDIHMIKNMEWGALAYLSQSKYGKYGNSLYTGDYQIIYNNNNSDLKTGYSSGLSNGIASNSETYLYNNLNSSGTGQGYLGAGASTTGNVYGIYDISGGMTEFALANISGNSSTYLDKYYDLYSRNTQRYTNNSINKGKLGDATKEVRKSINESYTSTGWYNSYRVSNFTSGTLFNRGGDYAVPERNSVFSSYYSNRTANEKVTSRPILAISREMPWLSE